MNVGDRPVRDVMVRLEHAAAVTSSAGLRTNLGGDDRPVRGGRRLHHGVTGTATRTERSVQADVSVALGGAAVARHRRARRLPASGQRQRHARLRRSRPPRRRPLPAARARGAAAARGELVGRRTGRRRAPRHVASRCAVTMLWPLGRPAAAGRGRTGRHHTGAADRRRPRRRRWRAAGGSTRCCRRSTSRPARRSTPAVRSRSALCLAVDPDLLVTVNAMTGGYVVNDGPDDGPCYADASRHRPGRGGELAESAQDAGAADVRRARELRAGRPRRTAARRRPRA